MPSESYLRSGGGGGEVTAPCYCTTGTLLAWWLVAPCSVDRYALPSPVPSLLPLLAPAAVRPPQLSPAPGTHCRHRHIHQQSTNTTPALAAPSRLTFPPPPFVTPLCLPAPISRSVGGGPSPSLHRLQSSPAEWGKPAFFFRPCERRSYWSISNPGPISGGVTTQASTARASQFSLGRRVSETRWWRMFCSCTVQEKEFKRGNIECFCKKVKENCS